MNILILSWRGPGHPNAGGAEISTHEHAKAWVKAGHNVTLFTASYIGAEKQETIDGVNVVRSGFQFFGVQVSAFIWYLFGNHKKIDLVVDQFHGIPFFTPLYVRVKKLAFIHEVTKEVWKLNPWPSPINLIPKHLGPLGEHWIFRLFYRNIKFMTVSESTKTDLIEWSIPAKNITVIHNGITQHKLEKLPKKQNKTVIYLGAISEDKGTDDAVLAFGKINKIDPDWKFWVVGKSVPLYTQRLKAYSEKIGIGDRLKFWGFVSERRKFNLLSKATVLINPSIREGWGLVNLEANSVGTPVVGYDVPGTRDSVINGKTGILVKHGDYKSLAKEIVSLYKNKNKYALLRNNSLRWAEKFTWEKATKQSLRLINSI